MKRFEYYTLKNEQYIERYELAKERMMLIAALSGDENVYFDFFKKQAKTLLFIAETFELVNNNRLYELSFEELKSRNEFFYNEISEETGKVSVTGNDKGYEESYTNPDYCANFFDDEKEAQLFATFAAKIRTPYMSAFKHNLYPVTVYMELLIQAFNVAERNEGNVYSEIYDILYWFISDYSDIDEEVSNEEYICPEASYQLYILENADITKPDYLFYYGLNITDVEISLVSFMNKFTDEEISDIARTYTEGYKRGFVTMNLDMSKKKYVQIRYHAGFDRMARRAKEQFESMGLEAVISSPCVVSTKANRQYSFDHRFMETFFLDKALVERKEDTIKNAMESLKDKLCLMAGPAVIETFGETPYEPKNIKHPINPDNVKKDLANELRSKDMALYNRYVHGDEVSFTIIAYPTPAIGNNFETIFKETIKINNLDNDLYTRIQATIIDALDKGEYARVIGTNGNKTDMTVNLWKLKDPSKETIFENCVADVNIPAGEVFTSPVLKGTKGTLNVSSVFLNDLNFIDLTLEFKDGVVTDYSCKNFDSAEENKKFIKENLLQNKETLPIGEFAIGTNTTAYVIAHKYDIIYKLPILIVEKMGPHFAIGDTCYKYSEETYLNNPNGKEIVAKENDFSRLRNEDPTKAYFNIHTDITLPYKEIGRIFVVTKDNEEIDIIKDGRFVLPGTEELNRPFDE